MGWSRREERVCERLEVSGSCTHSLSLSKYGANIELNVLIIFLMDSTSLPVYILNSYSLGNRDMS